MHILFFFCTTCSVCNSVSCGLIFYCHWCCLGGVIAGVFCKCRTCSCNNGRGCFSCVLFWCQHRGQSTCDALGWDTGVPWQCAQNDVKQHMSTESFVVPDRHALHHFSQAIFKRCLFYGSVLLRLRWGNELCTMNNYYLWAMSCTRVAKFSRTFISSQCSSNKGRAHLKSKCVFHNICHTLKPAWSSASTLLPKSHAPTLVGKSDIRHKMRR